MHELSLCQNIMEIIEQQAQQHQVQAITDLWLEISALSCVEPSALQFCFEISRQNTIAEHCQLHFIHIPAQAWCWQCRQLVQVQAHQDCCPICQNRHLQLQEAQELRIKEMAVK